MDRRRTVLVFVHDDVAACRPLRCNITTYEVFHGDCGLRESDIGSESGESRWRCDYHVRREANPGQVRLCAALGEIATHRGLGRFGTGMTTCETAAFWKAQGKLAKPTKHSGFFDFFGLGPSAQEIATKTSGADAENGPGLYVADDAEV